MSTEAFFWAKVDKTGECWIWTGARNAKGYGTFTAYSSGGRRTWLAHRFAYVLANGPIPTGVLACHRCDNPPCVNPGHIFLGSDLDNARDRDAKGRTGVLHGEAHGSHKMTEAQVLALLSDLNSGLTQKAAAPKYGISRSHVNEIARGYSWAHLPRK